MTTPSENECLTVEKLKAMRDMISSYEPPDHCYTYFIPESKAKEYGLVESPSIKIIPDRITVDDMFGYKIKNEVLNAPPKHIR